MALRILLADESLNVKKNLQIALQDFGVDVKTLLSGDEVLPAIKIFKPEIIFLDILLAKINGYDLCAQIKNHPDYRHIPVILIWSNFMHIDESKAKQCRADSTLEKPFDRDSIRRLVQHFVPKTTNQNLNEFLKMPPLLPPETNFEFTYTNIKPILQTPQSTPLFDKEAGDEFVTQAPSATFARSIPAISPLTSSNDEAEDWSQKNLVTPKAKSPTSAKSIPPAPPLQSFEEKNTPTRSEASVEEFNVEFADVQMQNDGIADEDLMDGALDSSKKSRRHPMMKQKAVSIAPLSMDEKQLEEIIRIQVNESIQHWIKKYLPEVAERLIKNEIDRLMKDLDKEVLEGGSI
jgi:CheY-like chemotaxis protein